MSFAPKTSTSLCNADFDVVNWTAWDSSMSEGVSLGCEPDKTKPTFFLFTPRNNCPLLKTKRGCLEANGDSIRAQNVVRQFKKKMATV